MQDHCGASCHGNLLDDRSADEVHNTIPRRGPSGGVPAGTEFGGAIKGTRCMDIGGVYMQGVRL